MDPKAVHLFVFSHKSMNFETALWTHRCNFKSCLRSVILSALVRHPVTEKSRQRGPGPVEVGRVSLGATLLGFYPICAMCLLCNPGHVP